VEPWGQFGVYFWWSSERELRNVELPWPGCPGRPGYRSRLVIMEYQDGDEVQSQDRRGTSASKFLSMVLCNTNKLAAPRPTGQAHSFDILYRIVHKSLNFITIILKNTHIRNALPWSTCFYGTREETITTGRKVWTGTYEWVLADKCQWQQVMGLQGCKTYFCHLQWYKPPTLCVFHYTEAARYQEFNNADISW